MATIKPEQTNTETIPYQPVCPRHGERVRPYYGCAKCVIEEVLRHERRAEDMLRLPEVQKRIPAA